RKDQAHDVEVALDQEQAFVAANRVSRPVQPVEQPALRERHRIGRVEVLRLARADESPAESGQSSGRVVNGEHESPPEPRPRLLRLLALYEKASRQQPLIVVSQRVQVPAEQSDLARCETEAELLGRLS